MVCHSSPSALLPNVHLQDSLLVLADLPEAERLEAIDRVIKELERKEKEAREAAEIAEVSKLSFLLGILEGRRAWGGPTGSEGGNQCGPRSTAFLE